MTIMLAASLIALVAIALMLAVLMAVAWIVQSRTGNSGWVDTIWTYSVGAVGAVAAFMPVVSAPISARQWLVAALISIWSARLGTHIALRTMKITDDPRYAEKARSWGSEAGFRMFVFLQQQAAGSIPLVFAVFVAAHNPAPGLGLQDYIGALIVLIGIGGEAISDGQLRGFRADPANAGKVCNVGLWRWSRHPNYFFEWVVWLAWPVIAISSGYAWGFLALLGPAFMYWILVHVTGIPPLEEHMLRTRGEAFRAYMQRTSAFFPRPPLPGG
jgi:steroid 5-alpha reductase family enzyme